MRVSKVFGAIVGLGLGFVGVGAVVAAEPPVVTSEDVAGIDVSRIIFGDNGNMNIGHSNGFTSNLNADGSLFAHRFLIFKGDAPYFVGIIFRQIDCEGGRARALNSELRTDDNIFRDETPGSWAAFEDGSIESRTCRQAYSDRATATR